MQHTGENWIWCAFEFRVLLNLVPLLYMYECMILQFALCFQFYALYQGTYINRIIT